MKSSTYLYQLLKSLVVNHFKQKYSDSFFGSFWIFASPILLVLIYDFVFKNASGRNDFESVPFAVGAFSGLIIFNAVIETLLQSTTLLQSNQVYVKKIKFPLEALCLSVAIQAALVFLASTIILSVYLLFTASLNLTALLLALSLTPSLVIFLVGLSLFFSVIGLYFKDTYHFLSAITLLLLFASPVFYSVTSLPDTVSWLAGQPIAILIELYREALFQSTIDISKVGLFTLFSFTFLFFSVWFFRRLKVGFSDVL